MNPFLPAAKLVLFVLNGILILAAVTNLIQFGTETPFQAKQFFIWLVAFVVLGAALVFQIKGAKKKK